MNTIRKTRSDDRLGCLPPEQRQRILQWLSTMSYKDTAKQIALPPPDGLGIITYPSSLHRFFIKSIPVQLDGQELKPLADSTSSCSRAEPGPGLFSGLTREHLNRRLLELAMSPQGNEKELLKLADLLFRVRALEVRERELGLAGCPSTPPRSISTSGTTSMTPCGAQHSTIWPVTDSAVPLAVHAYSR
jgi:hypothetical protein